MNQPPQVRITIDKIDQTKPLQDWKPLLADAGRRRHLSYTMDFDTRALLLAPPGENWAEGPRRQHEENRVRIKEALIHQFGELDSNGKIDNFVAIGSKPFSIISHHNQFFEQIRQSFVVGAYYPSLVGASALGERILNHLVLDLRDFYKNTIQYQRLYRKKSIDNWSSAIEALEAWDVLLPAAGKAFRTLMDLRHRSIHFNVSTYANLKEDALTAIRLVSEIIEEQFSAFGNRPWFIPGTSGHVFIKREWEANPFIKTYYLPLSWCPFVGPYFSISFANGLQFCDHADYGDGNWTDEEFAAAFEAKTSEQIAYLKKEIDQ